MVSDKGQLEWKKMYFKLSRCYPRREQYSDTLHFCTHCHILFWKVVYLYFLFFSLVHLALEQNGYETNVSVKLCLKQKPPYLILIDVSFHRTQTILAQPTTRKVAPHPSPPKTLSTFSTFDTPASKSR